jgi:UDPglucose 6-dehydrogenase
LCEQAGADVNKVRIGIGTDSRIGMGFIFPGIGYGGSCFPKDVQALIRTGDDHGVDMRIASAVEEVNRNQKRVLVKKIDEYFGGAAAVKGKTFGIWGLAFKPKTDDTREAPALTICDALLERGASVRAFDPEANDTFLARMGERIGVTYVENNYAALEGADALIICTEWNAFRQPNFAKIKQMLSLPVIFDGRNIYEPEDMRTHGFTYFSIGRPRVG